MKNYKKIISFLMLLTVIINIFTSCKNQDVTVNVDKFKYEWKANLPHYQYDDKKEENIESPQSITDQKKGELYFIENTPIYKGSSTPDFVKPKDFNLADPKSLINAFGKPAEASDVIGYDVHNDSGLIYNPLSVEASKTKQLDKYKYAYLKKGTIQLGSSILEYQVPTNVTAYDVVPIKYTLKTEETSPVYVEATAYEEETRRQGRKLNDMNVPGKIDVNYEFMGYVTGTIDLSKRPVLDPKLVNDTLGSKYPFTNNTSLIRSKEVKAEDATWFTFKYTNTGNTILDPDGNASFKMMFSLQKNVNGEYVVIGSTVNKSYRMTDSLYPGESREVTVTFTSKETGTYKLGDGDYRIIIENDVISEGTVPGASWKGMWSGTTQAIYNYDFSVSSTAGIVDPNQVIKKSNQTMVRNQWLHRFEEFMSSYDTWIYPEEEQSDVMFLQVAPWSDNITLKLINSDKQEIETVSLPIKVDTKSVKINFNKDNNNYVIVDGKKTPPVITQTMADMRTNIALGPKADEIIVNQLLDMKEAGINLLSNTSAAAFVYDAHISDTNNAFVADAFKLSMDVIRKLGMKVEGFTGYPYDDTSGAAGYVSGKQISIEDSASYADPGYIDVNVIKNKYQFDRWGDLYWTGPNNGATLDMEDLRGWLRIDGLHSRRPLGEIGAKNYQLFLSKAFGNISMLNSAWGTNFVGFNDVLPEKDAKKSSSAYELYDYSFPNKIFSEWKKPILSLDIYRTIERATEYKEILNRSASFMPNAKYTVRTESSQWVVPGINPNTTNPRYRQAYYLQRRGALIPEIMAASGTLYGYSDYVICYYTPSEVYELTKKSVDSGLIPIHIPYPNRSRDTVINELVGENYKTNYNLKSGQKAVMVNSLNSLFGFMKATYEAGGVAGVMWQDYATDGCVGVTQIRELKFFNQKMREALETPEGKAWQKNDNLDRSWTLKSKGTWSYQQEYLDAIISKVKASRKPNQIPS